MKRAPQSLREHSLTLDKRVLFVEHLFRTLTCIICCTRKKPVLKRLEH